MATITPTEPVTSPSRAEWIPSPRSLYRLSLEQYEAMVAAGIFSKRDRLHLINGYLVAQMTELPPHGAACDATNSALGPLLPRGWYIRSERVLKIPGYASMPEPDLVVVRGTWRAYKSRYPEPADTALVVEVAYSSLSEDRAMASIYGAGGVPIYWIVNLVDAQVEVLSEPGPDGYGSRRIFKRRGRVPVVIRGIEVGRIRVVDILP
jgi:Uma2 family endonuclease